MLNGRTGASRLGPTKPPIEGIKEEEEGDAYKVELAAPVFMLSEFERPNMVVEARRFAPRNTGLDIAMVSLLLNVCCGGRGSGREILTPLRLKLTTIDGASYCPQ